MCNNNNHHHHYISHHSTNYRQLMAAQLPTIKQRHRHKRHKIKFHKSPPSLPQRMNNNIKVKFQLPSLKSISNTSSNRNKNNFINPTTKLCQLPQPSPPPPPPPPNNYHIHHNRMHPHRLPSSLPPHTARRIVRRRWIHTLKCEHAKRHWKQSVNEKRPKRWPSSPVHLSSVGCRSFWWRCWCHCARAVPSTTKSPRFSCGSATSTQRWIPLSIQYSVPNFGKRSSAYCLVRTEAATIVAVSFSS